MVGFNNWEMTILTVCSFSQPSFHFRILSSRTVHDGLKNQELNSSDSGIDQREQANKDRIPVAVQLPHCWAAQHSSAGRVERRKGTEDCHLSHFKKERNKQNHTITCILRPIRALNLEMRFLHQNILPPAEDMWSQMCTVTYAHDFFYCHLLCFIMLGEPLTGTLHLCSWVVRF